MTRSLRTLNPPQLLLISKMCRLALFDAVLNHHRHALAFSGSWLGTIVCCGMQGGAGKLLVWDSTDLYELYDFVLEGSKLTFANGTGMELSNKIVKMSNNAFRGAFRPGLFLYLV